MLTKDLYYIQLATSFNKLPLIWTILTEEERKPVNLQIIKTAKYDLASEAIANAHFEKSILETWEIIRKKRGQ